MRLLVWLLLFLVGCAPAAPRASAPLQEGVAADTAPRRPLVIAAGFEPAGLEASFGRGSLNTEYGVLVSGYLCYVDFPYRAVPYLAAELPSMDAGTWKILPDGRMETLYKLRPSARFHDGHPITAADFAFAFQVRTNPAVPAPAADAEPFVAEVRVIDDHTMVFDWKKTYISAAEITGPSFSPMPRHLLADLYRGDIDLFVNGSHWREDFVGSGPYRLERWDPGSQMVLRAHEGFVLGKPYIDQITVRFLADANVVVANFLSGAVDMAFGATITYPQAATLQQNNWPGKLNFSAGNPRYVHFQMRDWGNTQRAVHDPRVRRAMLHAIDRESIVDTIYSGHAKGLHVWWYPEDPLYPAVEREITKYSYDMNRAWLLLEEAGWRRAADGVLRSAAGEALNMHLLAQGGRVEEQETEVIASSWRSLGMPVEIAWLAPAQQRDGEYRSKFPAVAYDRRSLGYGSMVWTSDNVTGPQNRWGPGNRNGYVNPRLDELWQRVVTTVPLPERERYLVEAMKVMTADAAVVPTHLQPAVMAYPAELRGIKPAPMANIDIWDPWQWRWQP